MTLFGHNSWGKMDWGANNQNSEHVSQIIYIHETMHRTCMVWYVSTFNTHIQTAYQNTLPVPSQKPPTVIAHCTFYQKLRLTVPYCHAWCGKQVGRWQLDSKTESFLCPLELTKQLGE